MKYLSLFLCLAISFSLPAQKRVYTVYMKDKDIGTVEATKTVKDSIEQYHVTTQMDVHLLVHVKISYKANTTYINGNYLHLLMLFTPMENSITKPTSAILTIIMK